MFEGIVGLALITAVTVFVTRFVLELGLLLAVIVLWIERKKL